MQRAKRVRFIDPVSDRSQSRRSEAASAPSNDPKTSEFAFFKKFREGSSLKHQSKLPSRGNAQLNFSKGKKCSGGGHSSGAEDNKIISNSSLFTENARPSKTGLLLSPHHVAGSRRSEQGNRNLDSSSFIKTYGRHDQEEDLELSPIIKTPTSSGTDDLFLEGATESVRTDTRYMDGDIFSKRRAKLQSWVSKTMFTGNDEILTGCDLISLLLNRLQPESYESNDSEAHNSGQDEEDAEYESVSMSKPGNLLKETWNERALVKHEEPCFMEVGAYSSWSNNFDGLFQLERPIKRGFPALDQMILGHQRREIEPSYFSNIDYKQSWNNNSAETLDCGTYGTFNRRRIALEHESFQEHPWNANPSSSRHYRFDNILPAGESIFLNADRSIPDMNNHGSRFLLEYEKREPEYIEEAPSFSDWSDSMLGNSPGKCRSSALETFIESDESNDELGYLRFRRKPSDLFLGWDTDRLKENQTRQFFPSIALMNYHQTPEISEVDLFQEFDSRSNPPLEISREFIPATDTSFLLSPSHQCLLPQRSYYNPLETPETAIPSPYLLLEGVENECKQSSQIREICYHSGKYLSRSPAIELIEASPVQKLGWRDTDEEDMYVL